VIAIDPESGTAFEIISDVTLEPNQDLTQQDFAIDPSGVVYDSITRQPVIGAIVTIIGPDGNPLPAACLLTGQMNPQTSSATGYRFDIVTDPANPTCPDDASEYTIQITAPAGYQDPASVLIPDSAGPFDPPATLTEVQPQITAPAAGESTTYYLSFIFQAGDAGVVNNHIPLDPAGISENMLRVTKSSSKSSVLVGEFVPYTVTVENISAVDLNNVDLVDDLPAGFSFVAGSETTNDADRSVSVNGTDPITISGVDIPAGETIEVSYLTSVGAGVVRGKHINTVLPALFGTPIGNEARATVRLGADPLLEEATILGKVWNDRDGDNWQDNADATGLFVQGGFDPAAYVPNSTTIDYGLGSQALADASSPMLHGVAVGRITGRRTTADPLAEHRVVISQLLSASSFDDNLVLRTNEGTELRMLADGSTELELNGDLANGDGSQELTIERSVALEGDNVRVSYVITNHGLHEMGVPGVRIATVEGLLTETDAHGRFHLAGIDVENMARGHNFIMKVDPFTLPPNTEFTTENPRVKRITQGLPTRFDFGVILPEVEMSGSEQIIEMETSTLLFKENTSELREKYQNLLDEMSQTISQYDQGDIYITATADNELLALERADVIHQALLARLSEEQKPKLNVKVVTEIVPDMQPMMSLGRSVLLGEVFFDLDKAIVKPRYQALIKQLAERMANESGGLITVTGHTDKRASNSYNQALSERRARAVTALLKRYLSEEGLRKINIHYQGDMAPVVSGSEKGGVK
jgi:uncharacterized repeat protein (TIGR01451 family)